MKIDFMISSLSGGGAENVLVTLANELNKKGNGIKIVSLEKRKQFYKVDDGIDVFKFNNTRFGKIRENIRDFKMIRKYLSETDADLIVSFLSRCNLLTLLAGMGKKKKIIVCDRNNPLREHSKLVFKISCIIYRLSKGIVVQTNQIKDMYPLYLQKKLHVIENPLNFEKLKNQLQNADIKRENTIISIGRLEPQKDFVTLIKAFQKARYKLDKEWKIEIYGIGKDESKLQELIKKTEMEGCVKLCGSTKTPFKELKKAKIFVLSSFYEGFPNVLCEAMYAGNVCVSSDCVSGPRELINSGDNGFLFEIGNDMELAEILIRVCNNSDELLQTKGKLAFESVQRLELSKIIKRWNSFFEQIEGAK